MKSFEFSLHITTTFPRLIPFGMKAIDPSLFQFTVYSVFFFFDLNLNVLSVEVFKFCWIKRALKNGSTSPIFYFTILQKVSKKFVDKLFTPITLKQILTNILVLKRYLDRQYLDGPSMVFRNDGPSFDNISVRRSLIFPPRNTSSLMCCSIFISQFNFQTIN